MTQLKQWRWHADLCADAVNHFCRDSGVTAEPLPVAGITTKSWGEGSVVFSQDRGQGKLFFDTAVLTATP